MYLQKGELCCIDAGHCLKGADTGAGCGNYREEVLTREIASKLQGYLSSNGFKEKRVDCESATTQKASLDYRTNKANATNCKLYVSIHLNAFNGNAYGTETYVYAKGGNAEKFANQVNSALVNLGFYNRGVKVANFHVLRETKAPAILIETCFIDSPTDMNRFDSTKAAKAIFKAITGIDVAEDKPPVTDKLYRVISGAFSVRDNALKRISELKAKGIESYIWIDDAYFKVSCGAYSVRDNAEKQMTLVKSKGFDAYLLYK